MSFINCHVPRAVLLALAGLASLVAWAPAAHAQAPTRKTINIDGDLSDWDEILTNANQTSLDGDGSVIPCPFSTDRDCPIQSAGRDLRVFAWTYDAAYLYVYLTRQGSDSNEQTFWFYLDLDADQKMEATDRVLRVRYNGSTGVTANALYAYIPVAPGGDPLVDANGFADGYDMPGDLNPNPIWSEGVPNGGSAVGDSFEERVPWSALGVPAGTALFFHVGSSNSPNPSNISSQVDDNMGGPGGSIGTLGFHLVSVTPDRLGTAPSTGTASYPHVVTNEGNLTDSFDLSVSSTLGLSVSIWADTNGDGVGDVLMATDANGDGDFADAGDFLNAAYDSNADGFPDTPPIPPGGTFAIVVTVTGRAGASDVRDVTTVSAWLPAQPTQVRGEATDTTDLGDVVVRADQSRNTVAGQNVSYPIQVCNNGAPDVFDLTAISSSGDQVTLFSDPECDGVGNDLLAQDRRGDGVWDTVLAGDSDGDGKPDTDVLATGQCACFVVQVRTRAGDPIGAVDTTRVVATGSSAPTTADAVLTSTITTRLQLFPDYTFAAATEKVSGAGTSVYFAHVARNNWVIADSVSFTTAPPTNSQGWTVRIWSDPDGDGNISDGQVITRLGPIPPNGGEAHFIVEVVVPPTVAAGTRDTTVVTGASVLDPATRDTVTDELEVSTIATYSDALFRISQGFFAPCSTVYVKGTGLGRQRDDVYDLVYRDSTGATVRFYDPFFPDVFGVATDSYTLTAPDQPGTWTIELRKSTVTIASITFVVEGYGVIQNLATDRTAYPIAGQPITISDVLLNNDVQAPLAGTRVVYVVLDPTGTKYLVSGATSNFQPYTGSETTHVTNVPTLAAGASVPDTFTVPNVTYPQEGLYVVQATWLSSCGTVLGTARREFVVGVGENCTNGRDDDGDTLIDCLDPSCALDPGCRESNCTDGIDSDGDTLIDCADPDCASTPACPELLCANGLDDNGNGLTDCADPDCARDPACHEINCTDGIDSDGDTLIDCADPDCARDPACPETDCSNLVDDDGDTLVDCADPDCARDPACFENDCRDGIDNDADGFVDCADPDCAGSIACVPEDCGNGIDDNGDTLVDCLDPQCAASPLCHELDCRNGLDDDNDTFIDCADPDCATDPSCVEADCTNGLDDDRDGRTDCADSDCAGDPTCVDTDGDTIPDLLDCAPNDPSAFALPGEVPRLDATKPAPRSTDALLTWTNLRPTTGRGTVYDVVTGLISELTQDRGFARATCLAPNLATPTFTDTRRIDPLRRDAFYYLVEAENACGEGGYGSNSLGQPRVIDPNLCD